jgi:protein gp37
MAITKPIRDSIARLKAEFDILRKGKDSLLNIIDEAEIPENVYNSNAIENSTLTLKESTI